MTIHDPTWNRTTNATGNVRDTEYAYVKTHINAAAHFHEHKHGDARYANQTVPPARLVDVLNVFQNTTLLFNIELKDIEKPDANIAGALLWEALKSRDMHNRALIGSFSTDALQAYRLAAEGDGATSASEGEAYNGLVPMLFGLDRWWYTPGPVDAMQIPRSGAGFDLTSASLGDTIHARDIALHYWTLNDKETIETVLESGADGVITDDVALMQRVLQEQGFDLPASVVVGSMHSLPGGAH